MLRMVAALFKTLLNVPKTAPITMAAKIPTRPNAKIFYIKSGYIMS